MKKIYALLVTFSLFLSIQAQNNFFKEINVGDIRGVTATNDGGYLVTSRFTLIKFDKRDDIEWSKKITDTTKALLVQTITVSEGGYLTLAQGAGHAELVRLDSVGNLIWNKNFYNSSNTPGTSIAEDWAGNFLLTGRFTLTGDGNTGPYGFLAKISPQGILLWKRNELPQTSNITEVFKVVCINETKRYVISGYQNSMAYIAIFDENGTPLNSVGYKRWTDFYGDNTISASGNNLYLLPNPQSSKNNTEGIVMKLEKTGEIVWQKAIGGNGRDFLTVMDIYKDTIMLAGETESFDYGTKKTEIYIVKMLTDGTVLWTKTIGTLNDERAVSIARLKNGNYIVAAKDKNGLLANLKSFLIKIDINGDVCSATNRISKVRDGLIKKANADNFVTGAFFTGNNYTSLHSISSPELLTNCEANISQTPKVVYNIQVSHYLEETKYKDLSVFPNPVKNLLTLKFMSSENTSSKIQIFNSTSQLVINVNHATQVGNNIKSIPVGNLMKGTYIVVLQVGNNILSTKFIKE